MNMTSTRLCRLMAVLLMPGLFCSACTPADQSAAAPTAGDVRDVWLKSENRPHTMLFYSPDINRYPVLAQRLAAETQEILDKECSYDYYTSINHETGDNDPDEPYNPDHEEASDSWYLCHLTYTMTVQTPDVIAVLGTLYYYRDGAHGGYKYRTHIWLQQVQQQLTIQQLLDDNQGFLALRDYVRKQLSHQWGEPLDDRARGGTSGMDDFILFQPLMDDKGKIAALRFVFPPYQVAAFAYGTLEVDVPVSILYPHVNAKYRDLFAQP